MLFISLPSRWTNPTHWPGSVGQSFCGDDRGLPSLPRQLLPQHYHLLLLCYRDWTWEPFTIKSYFLCSVIHLSSAHNASLLLNFARFLCHSVDKSSIFFFFQSSSICHLMTFEWIIFHICLSAFVAVVCCDRCCQRLPCLWFPLQLFFLPFGLWDHFLFCISKFFPIGFDDFNLSLHSDMASVAKAMASPESGLEVRDRMWLKITIPNAFLGKSTPVEARQKRVD